jgi:hypothetical protein
VTLPDVIKLRPHVANSSLIPFVEGTRRFAELILGDPTMTRTATLLAALSLVLAGPAVAACECCACENAVELAVSCCRSAVDAPPRRDRPCICPAQPRSAAIVTSRAPLKPAGEQHLLAVMPPVYDRAAQASAVAALDRGGPPRYGGLRTHAFLGVWLI